MAKDYYNTLGVDKAASAEEIKKAFYKLAHKHHPDKTGGDAQKFKEINEAYQVLSDEKKRTAYDRFGSDFVGASQGGGAGSGGFDFSGFSGFGDFSGGSVEFDLGDIFGDFFGGGAKKKEKRRKGEDIHIYATIELAEAAFGASRTVTLRKTVLCKSCGGSGGDAGSGTKKCGSCDGKGRVIKVQATILGQFQTTAMCQSCGGDGTVPNKPCKTCKGHGIERDQRNITFSIPPGIDDGQMVRITGEGEAVGKGVSGDLYVTVHVLQHPMLIRDGIDLRTTAFVPFSAVALGGKTEIKTLDDKIVILKIPSGTQSGKVFRIQGKGIVSPNGTRVGDLLVRVAVKTPEHLTRTQKKVLDELQGEGL